VPDHAGQTRLLLHAQDFLRVRPAVRQRDLDLNVLAGPHRGDGLPRVHLGGGAQDDGVHVVAAQRVVEVGGGVAGAVLLRDFLGLLQPAADDRGHGDAVDERESVQVLDAKRAGSGDCDAHGSSSPGMSRRA
jgi:hypothetical protein